MAKVILISQVVLPFSGIGSWTTLYKNYIQSNNHHIDYIVCEKPEYEFEHIKYSIVKPNLITKIYRKYTKKKYIAFINALDEIIDLDEKYIIQIVDNFNIVEHIVKFLKDKKIRNKCYIQFFYHSFPPFLDDIEGEVFFESINEFILLTHQSYLAHKSFYKSLPCKISILHNGIDNNHFFKLDKTEKLLLKIDFNVIDKNIFVWCSQDRPKKGLHIILEVWKKVFSKNKNNELWIIGCEPKQEQEGVKYLGKIPNDLIAKYLQVADCYLFSSLCQEGFPLSLTEALHSGNYCIASNVGGVTEVLQNGKLGKLIDNPHFVGDWVEAIENYLVKTEENPQFPSNLYTTKSWNDDMNTLIANAKFCIGA